MLGLFLLSTLLAGCGGAEPDSGGELRIEDTLAETASTTPDIRIARNGDVTAGLPVRHEPFDTPRLEELRLQEHLDDVVAPGADEWEQMLLLKNWVAHQWPAGNPVPYPPWDAIVILDWIRNGLTGGFCAQYAHLLVQSLAALGHSARYVEIGSTENPMQHFVAEVWSNHFDKWILLDANFNVHFERDGIPLSALEVHDAVVRSELDQIVAIDGPRVPGGDNPARYPYRTAELYYYLRIHLKANHLSMPNEPRFDRYNDMVEWRDADTVMWEDSLVDSALYVHERLTNLQSDDRAAFEARLNQVQISVEPAVDGGFDVALENNVFGFEKYQVRELAGQLGDTAEWQDFVGTSLNWDPTRKLRVLHVRGVNSRGIPGPASTVTAVFRGLGR